MDLPDLTSGQESTLAIHGSGPSRVNLLYPECIVYKRVEGGTDCRSIFGLCDVRFSPRARMTAAHTPLIR
jgi:hypothetical protein